MQRALGGLGIMLLNYFKDSEETVSAMAWAGFCQQESLPSLFQGAYRVGDPRVSPGGIFSKISCVAIADEKLPCHRRRKNRDASTNQSNNFGVSRKRFKPSTSGSSSE